MKITGINVDVIYAPERPSDVRNSFTDITPVKVRLHYNPEYDIDRGLKETINWYRNYSTDSIKATCCLHRGRWIYEISTRSCILSGIKLRDKKQKIIR